jgi:DNA-binding MarR family transcriptional regulator
MVFDPVVANPGRLRILAALASEPVQPFVQLRNHTGLTDGNLATHARRLESAGLVEIQKSVHAGKPQTMLHLTTQGREALAGHVRSLMTAMEPESRAPTPAPADHDDDDWVD